MRAPPTARRSTRASPAPTAVRRRAHRRYPSRRAARRPSSRRRRRRRRRSRSRAPPPPSPPPWRRAPRARPRPAPTRLGCRRDLEGRSGRSRTAARALDAVKVARRPEVGVAEVECVGGVGPQVGVRERRRGYASRRSSSAPRTMVTAGSDATADALPSLRSCAWTIDNLHVRRRVPARVGAQVGRGTTAAARATRGIQRAAAAPASARRRPSPSGSTRAAGGRRRRGAPR